MTTPVVDSQEGILVDIDQARRELLARAYALILSPAWNTPQGGNTPADEPGDEPDNGASSAIEPALPHDG